MTNPLSIDMRERLISAAEGGMSRRSAATRFGIAASAAIKWVRSMAADAACPGATGRAMPGAGAPWALDDDNLRRRRSDWMA